MGEIMSRVLLAAALGLAFTASAHAQSQTALAPWFDAGGFYNQPGAESAPGGESAGPSANAPGDEDVVDAEVVDDDKK